MVRKVVEDGETWYNLKDVCAKIGLKSSCTVTATGLYTVRKFPAKDTKNRDCDMSYVTKKDVEIIKARRTPSRNRSNGHIYCFVARGEFAGPEDYWVKIGKAVNLKKRLRQYIAANAPRERIGTFETTDMTTAENHMLEGFRKVYKNEHKEWFRVPNGRLLECKELFDKLRAEL